MSDRLREIILVANLLVLVYLVVHAVMTMWILLLSRRELTRSARHDTAETRLAVLRSPLSPLISIIIPAYDEEAGILDATRSALSLEYPNLEVIVVNDGSTDDTLYLLTRQYPVQPVRRAAHPGDLSTAVVYGTWYGQVGHHRLVVVDKENGGRADAVNAGIDAATGDLACLIDRDSMLESRALLHMARLFIEEPERMAGAGGTVRIANGCTIVDRHLVRVGLPDNDLARYRMVEYLRAVLASRAGWSRLNAMLEISGAFSVFRTDLLRRVGGLATDTACEDVELVVRIHRYLAGTDYRLAFLAEPVCWTEEPSDLATLRRQRIRGQHGLGQVLLKYRGMLFRPKYGWLGMAALPYFVAFELLGPVVETAGLVLVVASWWFGVVSSTMLWLFLALSGVFGALLSLLAVALEESTLRRYPGAREIRRLSLYGLAGSLGLRQLLAAWRVWALARIALRGEVEWGAIRRMGLGQRTRRRYRGAGADPGPERERALAAPAGRTKAQEQTGLSRQSG